ncbi:family 43 glycosylhydrolase [Jeotgalibaca porci]|uniref:family 43 glycosylhydrolase n=2 Tax=Jeotgalibaca porci TaxID=1868793 RepID=UPI00359F5ACC
MSYQLLNYQREAKETELYDTRLGLAMHLALADESGVFQPLNQNFGVLFAKAHSLPDGFLVAKALKKTWICQGKEKFYIIGIRVNADGTLDETSVGSILVFETENFIQYQELPLLHLSEMPLMDVQLAYTDEGYQIRWLDSCDQAYQVTTPSLDHVDETKKVAIQWQPLLEVATDIEGALPRNSLTISEEQGDYLQKKLITPHNIAVDLPDEVVVENMEELTTMKATLRYSDGSSRQAGIDWFDLPASATEKAFVAKGQVHQEHFSFPIATYRADPCIGKWQGEYYFIATNDYDDNRSLYIRKAKTIAELVTAQEMKILDSEMYPEIANLLWAPEFHIINDRLYIFHGATPGPFEEEQSHVMALKEGGNPLVLADWQRPQKVVKADGSPLITGGITLDMTVIKDSGRIYAAWSQRQFFPVDLGAWIYFAELNPDQPWQLLTEPVVLAKPDYGWDNNHTFVDEGPYALYRGEDIYLTISGAAVDSSYCVGYLKAKVGSDLLNPAVWEKSNYPLLTSLNVPGEFGPGHNAYVEDEEGNIWNTYHARPGIDAPRSSGIRRVHFDVDGQPILGMTEAMDVNPELSLVQVKVKVK